MSLPRAKSDIKRHGRQFSALDPLNDQGETAILYPDLLTRPRGIRRKQSFTPFRKSARLQEKQRLRRQLESQERVYQLLSPTSNTPDKEACSTVPSPTYIS